MILQTWPWSVATNWKAEQDVIFCPFCNCAYANRNERRGHVDCPVCQGNALQAANAEFAVRQLYGDIKDQIADDLAVRVLKEATRKLAPGYWRSEYRTLWRKLGGSRE